MPNPKNPLDWDRYQYGRSNPVRFKDPTGHDAVCALALDDQCVKNTNGNQLVDKSTPQQVFLRESVWPTDSRIITNKFGRSNTFNSFPQEDMTKEEYLRIYGIHAAVDIWGNLGSDIYSVYPGVVVYVNRTEGDRNGGFRIVIEHTVCGTVCEKLYSFYYHLQQIPDNIVVGVSVGRREMIGSMGRTGTPFVHLHYEVRTSLGVDANNNNYFPSGSWWANSANELANSWVDISSKFGGYDSFLPDDWKDTPRMR